MKLNREELEFHLSDIGIEKTLSQYRLTLKEVNAILYPKPAGESPRYIYNEKILQYVELVPFESPDACELNRVIKQNYRAIRQAFRVNKNLINSRSVSREDTLHNGFLNILKGAGRFVYVSDVKTIGLIRRSLKMAVIDEKRLVGISARKLRLIAKMEAVKMDQY